MVLQIALKLRDRLQGLEIKGNPVRVFLTRDADFFVPLQVRVEKARIFFLGYNLACWSSFNWWDPEMGSKDGNSYPIQRTYTFGVNVSF